MAKKKKKRMKLYYVDKFPMVNVIDIYDKYIVIKNKVKKSYNGVRLS